MARAYPRLVARAVRTEQLSRSAVSPRDATRRMVRRAERQGDAHTRGRCLAARRAPGHCSADLVVGRRRRHRLCGHRDDVRGGSGPLHALAPPTTLTLAAANWAEAGSPTPASPRFRSVHSPASPIARRLARAGAVHAPLQHEAGLLPARSEVRAGGRPGSPYLNRVADQQPGPTASHNHPRRPAAGRRSKHVHVHPRLPRARRLRPLPDRGPGRLAALLRSPRTEPHRCRAIRCSTGAPSATPARARSSAAAP